MQITFDKNKNFSNRLGYMYNKILPFNFTNKVTSISPKNISYM